MIGNRNGADAGIRTGAGIFRRSLVTVAAAATTATAATTTTAAAVTTTAAALGLGTGFVHIDRTAVEVASVQGSNGGFRGRAVGHFDERKAPGLARVAVGHDVDAFHTPEVGERLMQVVLGRAEAEIANKYVSQVCSLPF